MKIITKEVWLLDQLSMSGFVLQIPNAQTKHSPVNWRFTCKSKSTYEGAELGVGGGKKNGKPEERASDLRDAPCTMPAWHAQDALWRARI
jgi:hypothetical protein